MSRHRNFAKSAIEDYYDENYSEEEYDEEGYYDDGYANAPSTTASASSNKKKNKKKNKGAKQETQNVASEKVGMMKSVSVEKQPQGVMDIERKIDSISITNEKKQATNEGKGTDHGDNDYDDEEVFGAEAKKAHESSITINVRQFKNPAAFEKQKVALIESDFKEFTSAKPHLHMVVIGHVDAGKSTLVGHLLLKRNRVNERTIRQFTNESKGAGKSRFHFAWILDQDEQERSRGLTVDVGLNWFETSEKRITVLDCPGHRDFVPNMISGASQADVGILVISSLTGEFEAGFIDGGQTKEHAILARFLGVKNLIVAVNKLDSYSPSWDKGRYDQIVSEVSEFLLHIGFASSEFTFVPMSGFTGDNLDETGKSNKQAKLPDNLSSWYNGPSVIDLINLFPPAVRSRDKPIRFIIRNAFSSQTVGFCVTGKLEAGVIIPKERLWLCPLNIPVVLKGIEVNGTSKKLLYAGETGDVGLKVENEDIINSGHVLCPVDAPVPIVSTFEAQIVASQSRNKVPLLPGAPLVLFTQCTSEPAYISKIIALLAPDGTVLPRKINRYIPTDSNAIVEITVSNNKKVCLEKYSDCNELGRFSLRKEDETVAVGIVTSIISQHNPPLQM